MRRPSIFSGRGGMEIKMTPMIDVVFLLLVFFVWTASFQIVEMVMPSSLSAVTGTEQPIDAADPPPPEADFHDVVVRITWTGQQPNWQVNDTPMPKLDDLRSRLRDIFTIKADAPVIVHPDQNVPLGHVIDVYDITRVIGFEKVQFAASGKI